MGAWIRPTTNTRAPHVREGPSLFVANFHCRLPQITIVQFRLLGKELTETGLDVLAQLGRQKLSLFVVLRRVHHAPSVLRSASVSGYPHSKILGVLSAQYDHTTSEFKALHFSRLVKEAKIGKNMAKICLLRWAPAPPPVPLPPAATFAGRRLAMRTLRR